MESSNPRMPCRKRLIEHPPAKLFAPLAGASGKKFLLYELSHEISFRDCGVKLYSKYVDCQDKKYKDLGKDKRCRPQSAALHLIPRGFVDLRMAGP
jgi:hypothetical protein